MSKQLFDLDENPDQKAFVTGQEAFSGFFGGVGSGKSFGNILRILLILGQPKPEGVFEPARGVMGAESYGVLDDIILTQTWERIQNEIRFKAPNAPFAEASYIRHKKRAILKNGARLDFRSLDQPNKLRGREITVFGIDEGRNVPKLAWDRLFDRLRQPGYRRAGFVTSTPNGYDWMYDLFHPESEDRGLDPYTGKPFVWYNASTEANAKYLDPVYMESLKLNLSGLMLQQEYYGQFVGQTEGAVYPEWHPKYLRDDIKYDPALPLYSFWDFGIGDLGVCIFAQIRNEEVILENGERLYIPYLHLIDAKGQADWKASEWAEWWHDWLKVETGGRKPHASFGDPAGMQRNSNGSSWIEDLAAAGVPVSPAPKKAPDYGIRIIKNMMAGGRVLANKEKCGKLSKALSSYHWPMDASGNRKGNTPVHDWTSHYADPLRYGAASLLSFFPTRRAAPKEPPPQPGTVGYALKNITRKSDPRFIGQGRPSKNWIPKPVGRS